MRSVNCKKIQVCKITGNEKDKDFIFEFDEADHNWIIAQLVQKIYAAIRNGKEEIADGLVKITIRLAGETAACLVAGEIKSGVPAERSFAYFRVQRGRFLNDVLKGYDMIKCIIDENEEKRIQH